MKGPKNESKSKFEVPTQSTKPILLRIRSVLIPSINNEFKELFIKVNELGVVYTIID